MVFLRALGLFVLGLAANVYGTVILPGKPSSFYCLWSECSGYEWRNDWGPGIPTGNCVNQQRMGHPVYVSHRAKWFKRCPSPIQCLPQAQHRTMCKVLLLLIGSVSVHFIFGNFRIFYIRKVTFE